jgi:bifunctional ADP-heptose synthase (sugar kinase/adenylyltransferase)
MKAKATIKGKAAATLPDMRRVRVLVVGDVMLDRYWFGDVNRISPEAPVPVVLVKRTEERPGGAANVARNIVALGAGAQLLSVIGDDEAGNAQQLLRVDFERAPGREVLANKLDDYAALVKKASVVVLSDYGKGGLAHVGLMIGMARAAGKPVLVDPKGSDWTRYRGATVLTPNRAEFREVAGRWESEADLAKRAQKVRKELDLEALIVTRSEEGMSLFTAKEAWHEPTRAQEVFDVSGAGDTVIAALAAMAGAGADLHAAMRVANHAAGIVVGKLGTAVVHREELIASLGGSKA